MLTMIKIMKQMNNFPSFLTKHSLSPIINCNECAVMVISEWKLQRALEGLKNGGGAIQRKMVMNELEEE